jgi:small subunit ribosomal protein S13
MVRISGVNLPSKKQIKIGLTYIFGIGVTTSKKILASTSIKGDKRCSKLTDNEINKLRKTIGRKYQTEGDLRRSFLLNIRRLKEIRSAKGRRHRAGLPVRGQRTRTNARTRKRKTRRRVFKKPPRRPVSRKKK